MGFDDEVSHYRSSKDAEEMAKAEQGAARVRRSIEEYENALQAAFDYLNGHLHPRRLRLEIRMIRADIYTPYGYILYKHPDSTPRGLKPLPSAISDTLVDMLTTDGRVWSRGKFLNFEGIRSHGGYVFGLELSVDIDGHLMARCGADDPWTPFREHMVSLCAAAHDTHAARA